MFLLEETNISLVLSGSERIHMKHNTQDHRVCMCVRVSVFALLFLCVRAVTFFLCQCHNCRPSSSQNLEGISRITCQGSR